VNTITILKNPKSGKEDEKTPTFAKYNWRE